MKTIGDFTKGMDVSFLINLRSAALAVSVSVALSFTLGASCQTQGPKALTIEDALQTRTFGELMPIGFSPDGKWFTFTVKEQQRVKPEDSKKWMTAGRLRFVTGDDIFMCNVKNRATRNLTEGKGDNWLPTWSPDGHSLAFLSDRGEPGKARVWIWSVETRKLRQVSTLSTTTSQLEWTPDSKGLILTAIPSSNTTDVQGRKPSFGDEPLRGRVATSATVALYRSERIDTLKSVSDPWNLDEWRRDLILLDVRTGEAVSLVHDQRIATFRSSPRGEQVAFTIPKRFEMPGSQQMLFDLAAVSIKTKKVAVLAPEVRLFYSGSAFSWSPDGHRVAFRHSGPNERTFDCFVVDTNGGDPMNVTSLIPMSSNSSGESAIPLWDEDGFRIYFIHEGSLWRSALRERRASLLTSVRGHTVEKLISRSGNTLWTTKDNSTAVIAEDDEGRQEGIFEIDLGSGTAKVLRENGECYNCANVDEPIAISPSSEEIAFFKEDAKHPRDLWLTDRFFQIAQRLTNLNPQFEKYDFGSAQLVSWLTDDGVPVKGALLLPSGYEAGKRYPLVAWVYGGERLSTYYDRFGLSNGGPLNWQLLATRGYAVLLPDAPLHVGSPMFDLAKTVLPGVNRVIDLGIADADRLAVAGHSFGGYSTLALITQTTRFKVAIEMDGFSDLISSYSAMSPTGATYDLAFIEGTKPGGLGGTPWTNRERYVENSPFVFLDRVETPLLIVHGSEDSAVPPFLGDQVFVGMRRLGKEVVYAKYEKESHSPLYWSYPNQADLDERMISWFDRYLKQ